MSTADASIYTTAGDFVRLPSGKQLALAFGDASGTYVVLIAEDGSAISVGQLSLSAWGAGRVGNDILIAASDGSVSVLDVDDIPSTAGTSTLPVRTIVESGDTELWGAAGTQDAETGTCKTDADSLADTGADEVAPGALIALALIALGALAIIAARRRIGAMQ
jgi:hypothetical protein